MHQMYNSEACEGFFDIAKLSYKVQKPGKRSDPPYKRNCPFGGAQKSAENHLGNRFHLHHQTGSASMNGPVFKKGLTLNKLFFKNSPS